MVSLFVFHFVQNSRITRGMLFFMLRSCSTVSIVLKFKHATYLRCYWKCLSLGSKFKLKNWPSSGGAKLNWICCWYYHVYLETPFRLCSLLQKWQKTWYQGMQFLSQMITTIKVFIDCKILDMVFSSTRAFCMAHMFLFSNKANRYINLKAIIGPPCTVISSTCLIHYWRKKHNSCLTCNI
jgi:hypothetical protein